MSEPTHVTINFFIFGGDESQGESEADKGLQESIFETFHKLSPRQREIATLTALDMSNNEIASKLFISPETVKTHVRNILAKMGVPSKMELRYLLVSNDVVPPAEVDLYELPGP